jgi:hypothetical protein
MLTDGNGFFTEVADMKIDWKRKLTSRKLWLSIANFVSMLYIYFGHAVSDGEKIAAIILAGGTVIGYVIGEGLADSGDNSNSITNNYKTEED